MLFGVEVLWGICLAVILVFVLRLDSIKQLSGNRIAYTCFCFGIMIITGLLFNTICVLFARFFMPFREKEN